jgi:putative transposase
MIAGHSTGGPLLRGQVSKLRDELLACEIFNTLAEARVLIERWRKHYNTVRPHSALGYRPPAPEVVLSGMPTLPNGPAPTGSG